MSTSLNGKRLQGAAVERHRACSRTFFVLQVPGNAADAVACEGLQRMYLILTLSGWFYSDYQRSVAKWLSIGQLKDTAQSA
jgi:hypothetical protein